MLPLRLRPRARLSLLLSSVVLVTLLGVVPLQAGAGTEQRCKAITLYAEQLPNDDGQIRLGYGLTPATASIPGPTIELYVGECIDVTLVNNVPASTLEQLKFGFGGPEDLPLAVSIHPHGVNYTKHSDGTVMSGSFVPPGESRRHRWRTDQLSAGYWWYHDHVVGTEHGTGGLRSGLFGGLIVRRPGDLLPDRPTFVVAFGDGSTINLEHFPETPVFEAKMGERVEWLVFAWGSDHHSFHLHGHTWADNRTGILSRDDVEQRIIDNRVVAPADSFGFQVIAGDSVGPNDWMFHCHVQSHSDNGMTSLFRVLPPA